MYKWLREVDWAWLCSLGYQADGDEWEGKKEGSVANHIAQKPGAAKQQK